MSDQGEKTCPLCAEEMDLTDQQLKPCKCGYEICVWCWHHIMDMAEKDESEGRCPACRTPYNKEKIVGTAPNREKIVAEMSMEKRMKSHKGKNKTLESRKHLCSVRVIQRNLVYIVGLPLNLADEDILQHKEYFGQYGKVLKVSISRTAAGSIQQFPNNTCSIYITYSKEDEAVRCIQSVHGFLLDGRPLKACFGTTKYCHAWIRNAPCTNPDCLYLHEIGSEEDSFSKDEIISAYTRNRVQQITGVSNSAQKRSGTILPPPADNYCNNTFTSAKPITKTTTNNSVTSKNLSPPNSSPCRSAALPAGASWGSRASNNQPPPKTKPEMSEPVLATGPSRVEESNNKNKKQSKVLAPKTQPVKVESELAGNKPEKAKTRTESAKKVAEIQGQETDKLQPDISSLSIDVKETDKGSSSSLPTGDMGESSIISNILSLDFDPWDAPLSSPQNLAKLLGDSDMQQPSLILSNALKLNPSNESRFSFAREERSEQPSFHYNAPVSSYPSASRPPPGFSAPNRAPPPGFSSHERDGIELMDPAILAVVTDKLPLPLPLPPLILGQNFPAPQMSSFENEIRLRLLMQQSQMPGTISPFHPFMPARGHHWDVWNGVNNGNEYDGSGSFFNRPFGV